MGRRRRRPKIRDQCPKLRSLQNLRYQGPKPEYYLGSPRGWGRPDLSKYGNGGAWFGPDPATPDASSSFRSHCVMFLRLRRKKAILGVTFGGPRANARPPPHWSIARDCFELQA